MSKALFQGRKLIIATKHKKERVIAPLLEKSLGVTCFTDVEFDSDLLGTFSGEVERTLDPVATARKKCLLAMQANDCDLGVASEGSFGAHPSVFFASADDEILIFIDTKNNLEIIVREVSLETNFDGREVQSMEELLEFAHAVQFPSHGLILKGGMGKKASIIKGITDKNILIDCYKELQAVSDTVHVETDMRAMYNPSRMRVIKTATRKLVDKINTCCPHCDTPGFDITDVTSGLPCNLCGMPTSSICSHIYTCQHCKYSKERLFPNNKTHEDPMYCDYCNP